MERRTYIIYILEEVKMIFFYVKYADDYGDDAYYKVSGYLKTGYTEDE